MDFYLGESGRFSVDVGWRGRRRGVFVSSGRELPQTEQLRCARLPLAASSSGRALESFHSKWPSPAAITRVGREVVSDFGGAVATVPSELVSKRIDAIGQV